MEYMEVEMARASTFAVRPARR